MLVLHPGSDVWEEAPMNFPLQEGDTLNTQGGYAEIEFENGATAYLAENSVLLFAQLNYTGGARVTQLNLTQGAGTFYANIAGQDTFRVLTATFEVVIPGRAEVRVDAFHDGASVQVLTGEISVSTSAGSASFEKGQSVAIHQGDFQHLDIARLPPSDSFDQWVNQEGELIRSGTKNSLSYINSPNTYGLSDLSIYGTWVNFPGYGMSWRPFSSGPNWTPCANGIWTLDPRLGWIWISNEPWGWMPYHFGSWLLSPTLGWVWIPGGPSGLLRWEPSRVNWVHAGNRVGWVAMSPDDREGAPANLERGLVAKSRSSARDAGEQNQIVSGKDLRGFTPIKQPPADFASRPAPGASPPRFTPADRKNSPPAEGHPSIVFDRGTGTFINDTPNPSPVARATQPTVRTDDSQMKIPPPAPENSHVNRVLTPQAGIVPPSRTINGAGLPAKPATPPSPSQATPPKQPSSTIGSTPHSPAQPPAPQAPRATPHVGETVRPAPPATEPPPSAGISPPRH